jgi:hypothetical protein
MKYFFLVFTLFWSFLVAFDEFSVQSDIDTTKSTDELIERMQLAPAVYRHLYIDAIKKRSALLNQQKRERKIQELLEQQNTQIENNNALNALTGNSDRGGASNGAGSSGGGSSGHGGSGGSGGGGHGGGKK